MSQVILFVIDLSEIIEQSASRMLAIGNEMETRYLQHHGTMSKDDSYKTYSANLRDVGA